MNEESDVEGRVEATMTRYFALAVELSDGGGDVSGRKVCVVYGWRSRILISKRLFVCEVDGGGRARGKQLNMFMVTLEGILLGAEA